MTRIISKITIAIVACVQVGIYTADCWAVVIIEKGQSKPIRAYLVRDDTASVVIREVIGDGTTREREIPRSKIDDIIVTVVPARLIELHHNQPKAYRDYADELAEKRQDPEARDTSIRLYLISAYLDPENQGYSSLLGMVRLARNTQEDIRFRSMAYLLDPNHDPRVLKSQPAITTLTHNRDDDVRSAFCRALRTLRWGKHKVALRMSQRKNFNEVLQPFEDVLTVKEFQDACKDAGPLSPEMVCRLLTVEVALLGATEAPDQRNEDDPFDPSSWAEIVARNDVSPSLSVTLMTLTEFDPRNCHFQGGIWVGP